MKFILPILSATAVLSGSCFLVTASSAALGPHDCCVRPGSPEAWTMARAQPYLVDPHDWLPESVLDPYLDFPVVELPQWSGIDFRGPQVGVLVTALDPTQPTKHIFVASTERPSRIYGFEGSTGAPLAGFSPASVTGEWAGLPLMSAVPVVSGVSANPNGLPALPGHQLFETHGTGIIGALKIMRMLDRTGKTLWTTVPVNNNYGPSSTPPSIQGALAADGSSDATLLGDDYELTVYARSARTGDIRWGVYSSFGQQMVTPAIIDGEPGSNVNPSFVFCRGRISCLLEKHIVADGGFGWEHVLESAHIFPFMAVGNVDNRPGEEVIAISREGQQPYHARVEILNGKTGSLMRMWDLGEGAAWAPAPTVADIDGDGSPEILVQTSTGFHAISFDGGEKPGWPAFSSTYVSPVRSEAVVGDLDGDHQMEIVWLSADAGTGWYGVLDVFDSLGRRKLFDASVMIQMGTGMTPAISDVDADGHNELILAGLVKPGGSEAYPVRTLWVLDFSRGSPQVTHGAVPWGQFGSDSEHSTRALSDIATVAISPTMLSGIAGPGSAVTDRLAIGNLGGRDLTWELAALGTNPSRCGNRAPWVSLDKEYGLIAGAQQEIVTVRMDGSQLAPGSHDAVLCLTTNDPFNALLPIPLRLVVSDIEHRVDIKRLGEGSIQPSTPQRVGHGATLRFHLIPGPDYKIKDVNGCGGSMIGNELTTAPVVADCSVNVNFSSMEVLFRDGFESSM